MLRNFIYLLLISFLFVSCLVTPPESSSGSEEFKSNLRSLEVKCIEETHCKNNSALNFELVAFYTSDDCNDVDLSSPIIAISREDLQCNNNECSAMVKTFKAGDGIDDIKEVSDGTYALAVFVDINKNEFPDKNEPFYCNSDVEISLPKRLINIQVEISRKLDV